MCGDGERCEEIGLRWRDDGCPGGDIGRRHAQRLRKGGGISGTRGQVEGCIREQLAQMAVDQRMASDRLRVIIAHRVTVDNGGPNRHLHLSDRRAARFDALDTDRFVEGERCFIGDGDRHCGAIGRAKAIERAIGKAVAGGAVTVVVIGESAIAVEGQRAMLGISQHSRRQGRVIRVVVIGEQAGRAAGEDGYRAAAYNQGRVVIRHRQVVNRQDRDRDRGEVGLLDAIVDAVGEVIVACFAAIVEIGEDAVGVEI